MRFSVAMASRSARRSARKMPLERDDGDGQNGIRRPVAADVLDGNAHKRGHYENALVTEPEIGQVIDDMSREPTLPSTGFQSETSTVNV